jgi:hypothetical protein
MAVNFELVDVNQPSVNDTDNFEVLNPPTLVYKENIVVSGEDNIWRHRRNKQFILRAVMFDRRVTDEQLFSD